MLLPNFYHPFFLYCVKTPTNDDGNFGELEFLCTFVAKSKPLSKTRQSIANRTVSKSLPEHQPIVRNTLLQRVVAFLSKVTQNIRISTYLYKGIFCKTIEKLFCSGFINIIYTYIYSCVAKQVSRRIKVYETNEQSPTSASGFAAAKGGNGYL